MRVLFITLLSFVFTNCWAQKNAFVVIQLTGNAMNQTKNKKLMVGSKVAEGDKIKVTDGNLGLVCGTSNYVKLEKPGLYTMNSKKLCKPVTNSSLARIIKFKLDELNKKEHKGEWRNHLDNVGVVRRGDDYCTSSVQGNLQYINYQSGEFVLSWKPGSPDEQYFLRVYERTDRNPVVEVPVTTNSYKLSVLKKQLREGTKYFWLVATERERCRAYNTLQMATSAEREAVMETVKSSVNEYTTDEAEQRYLQGMLLENKHFFADAFYAYQDAVRLSPNNQQYTDELQSFITKYNMPLR